MRREVEILNELGLHARPAAEFVRAVKGFDCEVTIHNGTERFNAESILEVMTANLDRGARIVIEAEGPEAEVALDRLEALLHEFKVQEEQDRKGNAPSFPA